MNKPIRRLAVVALVMFFALLVQGTQIMVFQQNDLNSHPQNRRVRDAQFGGHRGAIVAGDTDIAVSSQTAGGQFDYQREYPGGPMYAHVTGYYSYDRGASGLENTYNAELAGTSNSLFVRRFIDTVTGEQPQGASVETSIVPAAQQAAWDGLGGNKGAVVALDAETGEILAFVSRPSYDPGAISQPDVGASNQAYEEVVGDERAPLANRAGNELYPPGSVFKLVTAAAALENGYEPTTPIDTPSELTLPGTNTQLGNQTNCGNSTQTLDRALQLSCNTSFANIGVELGDDTLREQANAFGWDWEMSEIPGVAAQFPSEPDDAQTAMSAIGQFEVAGNPLHMAMVTAGIANDGVVMEPHLMTSVRAANLTTVSSTRPTELSRAMSADNAEKLQNMMVNTVTDGTGTNAAISGTRVGGKTGTAQSSPDRPPYAWFTSFAEGDDRTVAVAVFVESANVPRSEIGGNAIAAPIARDVMQELT